MSSKPTKGVMTKIKTNATTKTKTKTKAKAKTEAESEKVFDSSWGHAHLLQQKASHWLVAPTGNNTLCNVVLKWMTIIMRLHQDQLAWILKSP